jgi:peptidoglycan/xylan/chitin deacetylase (PgdA/CDA1 family)
MPHIKPLQRRYFLLVFLIIVACVVTYGTVTSASNMRKKERANKFATQKVLAALQVTSTPTPTFTPTPTVTPTPSPVPMPVYTGYCIHAPVLMYHHLAPYAIAKEKGFTSLNVDNGIFDQQMGYISSHGFTTIFAEDLANALKNHTALPSKSIIVTVDDGYEDMYTYAFPIIKKYNIKTSLMVPTGLMGVNSGTNSYYSWSELKEMVGSGLIKVYNHTFSHFAMSAANIAKDQFEVATAQQQLHDQLGITNTIFAYPYGTNATSQTVQGVLQQNGITGAFSTIGGSYQCDSFIYSLHRIRVGGILFPAFGIY